ncbi:hypothetical protein JTE90_013067 [Oedothorax gibbosus]|uniref:CCHC-type domain-containing protein n=1 Tax=Oedothorax gibbosus TaxID=931172 RepID=A0AAV6TIY1_9ARAC|nr:hypothetical protein JTE90_013067 [Oedothorax gibbosus]
MSVPTLEDQQLVTKIFFEPSMKEKYRIYTPKEPTLKLMIKFSNINCPNELSDELSSKNPSFTPDSYKVFFSMKAKNDFHWIIELEKSHNPLVNTKFVYVGLKKCACEPFISVLHCKNCGEYGHSKKRCQAKESRCLSCGTPSPDQFHICFYKCLNCVLNNSRTGKNDPTFHKSGHYQCAEFIRQRHLAFKKSGVESYLTG